MPTALEVDAAHFSAQSDELDTMAELNPHTRTLRINPASRLWDEQYRRMLADPNVREFSTPDPQGTVYHEYAHLVVRDHYAGGSQGGAGWMAAWAVLQNEQPDQQPIVRHQALRAGGPASNPFTAIAGEVSARASVSALEFVSEVFAAVMTGQPVSPRARLLYDDMAPPELRRLTPPGP